MTLTLRPVAGPVAAAAAAAVGGQRGSLPLGQHNLAVVPGVSHRAPALVHPPALPPVDACHETLAVLAPVSEKSPTTLAPVLLNTLASILALDLTDASLTVAPLEPWRTGAAARGSAGAPVEALWVAECHVTVLPHVALRTLALLAGITHASILALLVALRIWALLSTLLP